MEFLKEGVRIERVKGCQERCGELCREGAVLLATGEELAAMGDLPRECVVLVIEGENLELP